MSTAQKPNGPDSGMFGLRLHEEGGAAVVQIEGDLDFVTSPRLHEMLTKVVAEDPARRVVVDLAKVTFLDSTALGLLVGAQQRIGAGGGELVLRSPTRMVRRVLEVSGLTETFTITD